MQFNKIKSTVCIATLLTTAVFSLPATSCTGLQLKAKDGSVVNGRTAEFGRPLDFTGIVIPRNYKFKGTLPDGSAGLNYESKYAVVGTSMFGDTAIADGLNEKGLAAGIFYFPEYAEYAKVTPENKDHGLSPTEFTNWALTQFSTVDELKQNLKSIAIMPTSPKGWGIIPPFHYVFYDKSGKSIVVEPIKGELKVYDNPIGVMTNSPTFDWHLTNLSNYVNLSPLNAPSVDIDGTKVQAFGEGSGLHGLPGDFTPPSRFIRAALFSSTAKPSPNADEAVMQGFHILNQFDIPVGAVRSKTKNGGVDDESTLATTMRDPQSLKYYFRTFDNPTIKMVNLKSFDLNSKDLKYISMKGTNAAVDVSDTAK